MRVRRHIIQNRLHMLHNGTMRPLNDRHISLVRKRQPRPRQCTTGDILSMTQTMRSVILATRGGINIFNISIRRSNTSNERLLPRYNTGLLYVKRLYPNTCRARRSLPTIHATPRRSIPCRPLTTLLIMETSTLLYGGNTRHVTSLIRRTKLRLTIQTKSSTINASNMGTSTEHAILIRTRERLRLITMTICLQKKRSVRRQRFRPTSTTRNIRRTFLLNTRLYNMIRVPRTTPTTKAYRQTIRQGAVQQKDRRLIRGTGNVPTTILCGTRPNFIPQNDTKRRCNLAVNAINGTTTITKGTLSTRNRSLIFLWERNFSLYSKLELRLNEIYQINILLNNGVLTKQRTFNTLRRPQRMRLIGRTC